MAVYDGVPSIRLEGDEKRALALIPEAKALLQTVQTLKNRAGVGTFSMSQRIDEDSTLYVLSTGSQNILQISVAPDIPEEATEEYPEFEPRLFPDFYSGVVFRGHLIEQEVPSPSGGSTATLVCSEFAPTPSCVTVQKDLRSGRQDVSRLAVRPWDAYRSELGNSSPTGRPEFSQYAKLRPSMYSGTMKQVVQLVMGLGRIGKPKMRDPKKQEPDSKYIRDVGERGVQVRFDWRFIRTHGITKASDGRLWLIEISQARGVLAMPLPIFPTSDTTGFRNRAESRGDAAMEAALDALGCLPTGQAFPATGAALSDAIASGDILRLLPAADLADFYKCSAYSSSMGWAFNSAGTEAHNTAYYFGDDGFQRGVWYQINVSIGDTRKRREPGEPIAVGTANMVRNREGFIYCPPVKLGSPARYVPIKFHEPMSFEMGLQSHEGVPTIEAAGKPAPKCDTPMFVSFIDDELKVVNFYRSSAGGAYSDVEDDRDPGECILSGSWTITEVSGNREFPTMMYSNDFDDREVLQERVKVTTIKSEDLGFDPPRFSDFIQSPETSFVSRSKIFRRTTVVDNRGGQALVSAVAIPEYSREAYYYATASKYNLGRNGSTTVAYDAVGDPNVGYAWRCFPRINAPPFPPNRPDCNTRVCRGEASCGLDGRGFPKERKVVCLDYVQTACSDFADSGPWLKICDVVDGFNQPGMYKTGSRENWDLGGDERARLRLVTPSHGGPVTIPVTASQVFNHWMAPSPDPESLITQHIRAEHSALGEDFLKYSTGLSSYSGGAKTVGYSPEPILDADGFPTFIGVNQP